MARCLMQRGILTEAAARLPGVPEFAYCTVKKRKGQQCLAI
jgi:hypothetical protein